MKQVMWRTVGYLCIALLLSVAPVYAQSAMSLGSGEGQEGTLTLSVTTDEPVEGIVASVQFDSGNLVVNSVAAPESLEAELVVADIYGDGFTYSLVMDVNEPFDGQTIPVGTTVVGLIDVSGVCPDADEMVNLEFVDGVFGMPPLANLLVIGGQSLSVAEGLALNGGDWTLPKCEQTLIVESTSLPVGVTTGSARVLVQNMKPVEGFVVCLAHEAGIALADINLNGTATEAAGAEFVQVDTYNDGGTIGVVLDFDPPFDGQTIPVGTAPAHIANFTYQLATELPPNQTAIYDLTLLDDTFGMPVLQNLLVEDGLSVFPMLENGTISFTTPDDGDSPITFSVNDDGTTIGVGACADVGFFYTSEKDPIQGVSIAALFDDRLTVGDIILDGSITAAVNAEFVNHHADNGELIIGILVDSTPPVSVDRMFPSTDTPTLICRIEFCDLQRQLNCGECLPITFANGITGAGSVPINNRAAVYNESVPANTTSGELCVVGAPEFLRGDCNFDGMVDIADPAAILSHVFLGVFFPPCQDACDANDDGVVDLADSVKVLRWLFKFGSEPPAPGPYVLGLDPTPDIYGSDLGCEATDNCN